MKSLLITILLLTPVQVLRAQQEAPFDPDQQVSVEHLQEDVALLRAAMEEGHAGLYRYSSKAEMDRRFDETARQITGPMTELEFIRLLAPLIAFVNDGHTGMNPSQGLTEYLNEQAIRLPFKLKFIDGKAYLHRNYSDDDALPMGGQVTALNGRAMDDVVAQMLPTLPSDGRVVTAKYRRLEGTNTLGQTYSMLFGLTTQFNLTYIPPGESIPEQLSVDGLSSETLNERFEARYPDLNQTMPPIELTYRGDIPILTVRTFGGGAYQRAGINYAQFLKDAFEEFAEKQVRHLIIDVRDNGGGSDAFGKMLFAYLTDEEFMYYESLLVNKNHFNFLEYASMSNDDIPQDQLRENGRGAYDLLGHPNLGIQQPLPPTFDGTVYILINGSSFSATGEFTSVTHHHEKAVFVGEESGAGYYGNTSGAVPTVTLPHTGVRVRVPLVRYTMAVSGYTPEDRGLIPDHPVTERMADVMAGRDTVLEFVLALIRGQ